MRYRYNGRDISLGALALMLDPVSDFSSSNAKMQREVPTLLAPAIDELIKSAYTQCGLQQLGIRYYPLPVDAYDGSIPTAFVPQHEAFAVDFGPHPLGKADPSTADVPTVLSLAASGFSAGRTQQEEVAMEGGRQAGNMALAQATHCLSRAQTASARTMRVALPSTMAAVEGALQEGTRLAGSTAEAVTQSSGYAAIDGVQLAQSTAQSAKDAILQEVQPHACT